MPAKVEKRREFLINLLFLAAVMALIYIFFKYLFWVSAPFTITFAMAIALQKPIRALDKKCKKNLHTLWSILAVVLTICVILIPLGFLLSSLISKISDMAKYVITQLNDLPAFLATLEKEILDLGKFLPAAAYESFSETVSNFFSGLLDNTNTGGDTGLDIAKISNSISNGFSGFYGIVKNIPSVMIGLVISIIAWIFFTKDYNRIVRFIQLQFPEDKKNILFEIKQVFSKTVLKMIRAYSLILLITFGELFLGFSLLRMMNILTTSHYIWIAAGIAIFDIMPIAGSGGILIPWILVALILGNYKLSLGLLLIYILISIIRQYMEPKIVGDSLGVHPLITLMGLYFGLKLFGFLGMFIVPLTVMTLKAFNDAGRIELWKPANRLSTHSVNTD